jgi:ATP-binding protein involved in chromosome partitioning
MNLNELTDADLRRVLGEVRYPGLNRDIVSLGMVRSVTVRDGRVHVSLVLSTSREDVPDLLRASIREALLAAGAVRSEVQIVPPERHAGGNPDPWAGRGRLPGVGRLIAVGAGKGGVGKSTVATNLALALRAGGLRVGLLDADIYGPSVPVLLGVEDGARRIGLTEDGKVIPLQAYGIEVVSFGFFLGAESPAVWRGPMVGKAVKQFTRGVVWPDVDILVVDLPPGTGDVPLTLAQTVVVDGAVVVSTPQRLAVLEAAKAVEMFGKLDIPVLGVVENMSYALCECGRRSHPFGAGGGDWLANEAGIELLGAVPFDAPVVEGGDRGEPAVASSPDGPVAEAFYSIAEAVVRGINTRAAADAEMGSRAAHPGSATRTGGGTKVGSAPRSAPAPTGITSQPRSGGEG